MPIPLPWERVGQERPQCGIIKRLAELIHGKSQYCIGLFGLKEHMPAKAKVLIIARSDGYPTGVPLDYRGFGAIGSP